MDKNQKTNSSRSHYSGGSEWKRCPPTYYKQEESRLEKSWSMTKDTVIRLLSPKKK